ncbi:MAG: DNA polymerase III subunit delta' [Muribaculaceae bacterium]|nr:DNA polymerase III subunit delta' [Muribaculaceae bacterium]
MKFSEIAGHKQITGSLKDMVETGNLPHALLFTGISGIGKFRVARAFAQYIHCKNRNNGDSCGVCASCLQHQKHNNPDVHFIYPIVKKDGALVSKDLIELWKEMLESFSYMPPEKWNDLIKAGNSQPAIFVDESEAIIARASLSAFQENLKIFIVWQPEKLRTEAANKLLKVIEEPFEDTVFILVSNDDSKILPTILSRTQRFHFKPLDTEEIRSLLLNKGIDPKIAAQAAAISEGSLEKAEELACHPEEINEFSYLFKEMMRAAYALKAKKMKEYSENAAAFGREKLIRFLSYCGKLIRDNYLYNFKIDNLLSMTDEDRQFSEKFSPFIHEGNVESIQKEIARAASDIERNVNSKIVMFDLMLLISRLVRTPKTNILPFIDLVETI